MADPKKQPEQPQADKIDLTSPDAQKNLAADPKVQGSPDVKKPEVVDKKVDALSAAKAQAKTDIGKSGVKLLTGNAEVSKYLDDYFEGSIARFDKDKDGKIDEKEIGDYQKAMIDKTNKIIGDFREAESKKDKVEKAAANVGKLDTKEVQAGLDSVKPLAANADFQKSMEEFQQMEKQNAAFQQTVMTQIEAINAFHGRVKTFQEAEQGFSTFVHAFHELMPGDKTNDEALAKIKADLETTKAAAQKALDDLKTKKGILDANGKAIQAATEAERNRLIKERDEKLAEVAAEQQKEADVIKERKEQHDKLTKKKEELEKRRKELGAREAQNADITQKFTAQSQQEKLKTRREEYSKSGDDAGKEVEALTLMSTDPNLTPEAREELKKAIDKVKERQLRTVGAVALIDKRFDDEVKVHEGLADQKKSIAGEINQVDGHLNGQIKPSIESLDSTIAKLESLQIQYSDNAKEISDYYNKEVDKKDKLSEGVNDFMLSTAISRNKSIDALSSSVNSLNNIKLESSGVIMSILKLPQGLLHGIGKGFTDLAHWMDQNTTKALDEEEGLKNGFARFGVNVLGFFSGILSGASECVGGIFNMAAHPLDTLGGLGHLVGIDVANGKFLDGATFTNAWKNMGKAIIGYDDWEKGNYGQALGKMTFNIGSMFIGAGEVGAVAKAGEAGAIALNAARNAATLAGREIGVFTGRGAQMLAMAKSFGASAGNAMKPAFVTKAFQATAGKVGFVSKTVAVTKSLAGSAGGGLKTVVNALRPKNVWEVVKSGSKTVAKGYGVLLASPFLVAKYGLKGLGKGLSALPEIHKMGLTKYRASGRAAEASVVMGAEASNFSKAKIKIAEIIEHDPKLAKMAKASEEGRILAEGKAAIKLLDTEPELAKSYVKVKEAQVELTKYTESAVAEYKEGTGTALKDPASKYAFEEHGRLNKEIATRADDLSKAGAKLDPALVTELAADIPRPVIHDAAKVKAVEDYLKPLQSKYSPGQLEYLRERLLSDPELAKLALEGKPVVPPAPPAKVKDAAQLDNIDKFVERTAGQQGWSAEQSQHLRNTLVASDDLSTAANGNKFSQKMHEIALEFTAGPRKAEMYAIKPGANPDFAARLDAAVEPFATGKQKLPTKTEVAEFVEAKTELKKAQQNLDDFTAKPETMDRVSKYEKAKADIAPLETLLDEQKKLMETYSGKPTPELAALEKEVAESVALEKEAKGEVVTYESGRDTAVFYEKPVEDLVAAAKSGDAKALEAARSEFGLLTGKNEMKLHIDAIEKAATEIPATATARKADIAALESAAAHEPVVAKLKADFEEALAKGDQAAIAKLKADASAAGGSYRTPALSSVDVAKGLEALEFEYRINPKNLPDAYRHSVNNIRKFYEEYNQAIFTGDEATLTKLRAEHPEWSKAMGQMEERSKFLNQHFELQQKIAAETMGLKLDRDLIKGLSEAEAADLLYNESLGLKRSARVKEGGELFTTGSDKLVRDVTIGSEKYKVVITHNGEARLVNKAGEFVKTSTELALEGKPVTAPKAQPAVAPTAAPANTPSMPRAASKVDDLPKNVQDAILADQKLNQIAQKGETGVRAAELILELRERLNLPNFKATKARSERLSKILEDAKQKGRDLVNSLPEKQPGFSQKVHFDSQLDGIFRNEVKARKIDIYNSKFGEALYEKLKYDQTLTSKASIEAAIDSFTSSKLGKELIEADAYIAKAEEVIGKHQNSQKYKDYQHINDQIHALDSAAEYGWSTDVAKIRYEEMVKPKLSTMNQTEAADLLAREKYDRLVEKKAGYLGKEVGLDSVVLNDGKTYRVEIKLDGQLRLIDDAGNIVKTSAESGAAAPVVAPTATPASAPATKPLPKDTAVLRAELDGEIASAKGKLKIEETALAGARKQLEATEASLARAKAAGKENQIKAMQSKYDAAKANVEKLEQSVVSITKEITGKQIEYAKLTAQRGAEFAYEKITSPIRSKWLKDKLDKLAQLPGMPGKAFAALKTGLTELANYAHLKNFKKVTENMKLIAVSLGEILKSIKTGSEVNAIAPLKELMHDQGLILRTFGIEMIDEKFRLMSAAEQAKALQQAVDQLASSPGYGAGGGFGERDLYSRPEKEYIDEYQEKLRATINEMLQKDGVTMADLEKSVADKFGDVSGISKSYEVTIDGLTVKVTPDGQRIITGGEKWVKDLPKKKLIGQAFEETSKTFDSQSERALIKMNGGKRFANKEEYEAFITERLRQKVVEKLGDQDLTGGLKVYFRDKDDAEKVFYKATIDTKGVVSVKVYPEWIEKNYAYAQEHKGGSGKAKPKAKEEPYDGADINPGKPASPEKTDDKPKA